MENAELLAGALAGDERSFTTLVVRYQTSLVRLARYYVATDQQAEDIARETWVAVLRGVAHLGGRSSFKTCMHTPTSCR
jgi:RNA polymerase sigma-70 factor (ECF subfamily)